MVSSFLTQYGLRIRTKEFETVSWDEFKSLLSGIDPETPLGRIVAIRAETDKKVIKGFNRDQKRIYDAWRNRKAETMSLATYDQEMKALENMLADMCR
ncbi:Gp15 family bacteriophage protein [Lacrimispora xylanisolvens]|uniref:Gp15 family bacteriophage protein n=1 Tax=Lacrimispora xylanisolvens TaxID=384636 RepID=UPI000CEBAF1F|nr:Gp15 family bacteriophage protein [Hungatella xylanolytica]